MKRLLLSTLFFLFVATAAQAQSNMGSHDYTTAIGVKFYPGAITLKHFINDKHALEGIAYFWNRGTRITGLYEIHSDINGVDGLKWYVGPGAHVGFYNNKYYAGGTYIGIDGVLGLDYKIKEAPLNFSVDWQPAFEFGDGAGFSGNWGGISIRYVL